MLAEAVPELAQLEREARAVRSFPGFCANAVWYGYRGGGFKDAVLRLVGWGAEGQPAWLKTRQAYDLAYDHLYQLLPDCRWVDDARNRCQCG